ncbi:MAG: hypothetical protein ABFD97_08485 [Syntrophobacter sp.]
MKSARITLLLATLLVLLPVLPVAAQGSDPISPACELASSGKSCSENQSGTSVDCDFKVGQDLQFSIVGIGQPDVKVIFSNSSINGDYYASFSILEGCVVVKHGKKGVSSPQELRKIMNDVAHISPKDANVYKTWEECLASWQASLSQ